MSHVPVSFVTSVQVTAPKMANCKAARTGHPQSRFEQIVAHLKLADDAQTDAGFRGQFLLGYLQPSSSAPHCSTEISQRETFLNPNSSAMPASSVVPWICVAEIVISTPASRYC